MLVIDAGTIQTDLAVRAGGGAALLLSGCFQEAAEGWTVCRWLSELKMMAIVSETDHENNQGSVTQMCAGQEAGIGRTGEGTGAGRGRDGTGAGVTVSWQSLYITFTFVSCYCWRLLFWSCLLH